MKHLFGHNHNFWHDLFRHHAVYTAIIVVFRATAPDTKVCKSLVLKKFRSEDSGSGDFRGIIMFQNIVHLLTVIALCYGFSTESGAMAATVRAS